MGCVNTQKLQDHDYIAEEGCVGKLIPQIPLAEYQSDYYNKASIRWLKWIMPKKRRGIGPIYIRIALNKINKVANLNFKLDSSIMETNTA